jgi:hypothetical protein
MSEVDWVAERRRRRRRRRGRRSLGAAPPWARAGKPARAYAKRRAASSLTTCGADATVESADEDDDDEPELGLGLDSQLAQRLGRRAHGACGAHLRWGRSRCCGPCVYAALTAAEAVALRECVAALHELKRAMP